MAQVEVSDYVLWTKKVHGDEELKRRLEMLEPGETVTLRVDGTTGVWRKMRANATGGYGVPGLTPLGQAKSAWGELYRRHKPSGGTVVELAAVDEENRGFAEGPAAFISAGAASGAVWASPSEADREAAWEAVKASWSGGWRSDQPYGSRDELHDRDRK